MSPSQLLNDALSIHTDWPLEPKTKICCQLAVWPQENIQPLWVSSCFFFKPLNREGRFPLSTHQSPFPTRTGSASTEGESACIAGPFLWLHLGANILLLVCRGTIHRTHRRTASGRPLAYRDKPHTPYQLYLLLVINFWSPPSLLLSDSELQQENNEIWPSGSTPTPVTKEHF